MNSNEIQNMEPNHQQLITSYTTNANSTQNFSNPHYSLLADRNPQISYTIQETKNITQSKDGINTSQEIKLEGKNIEINDVPFKSLMHDGEDIIEEQEPAFSSKHLTTQNNLFNNTSTNPFAQNSNQNSKKGINNEINKQTLINQTNQIIDKNDILSNNKIEKYFSKTNKSHDTSNIIKKINIQKNILGSVYRIQTFKSQDKKKGRLTTFVNPFNPLKNDVLELNKTIEENQKYKLLVKRIAIQLKRKVKPPTQGFFYKYIKKEQYRLLIRRIALQLKIRRKLPTHGFFYRYIKKEQYILLIKRIAFQLKRRTKFPTCKILKVYESYRKLIKRIAGQLKASRNKRLGIRTTTTIKTTTVEKGFFNNDSNNTNANYNINYINSSNMNNTDQNIISMEDIHNKEEKMDIEVNEEIKHISPQQQSKESSLNNSIKVSDNNFSFGQESIKSNQELNRENNKVAQKIETIENKSNVQISQNSHNIPILESKNEEIINNVNKIIKEGNIVKSIPSSNRNKKNINISLSMFKKEGDYSGENNLKLSEEKKAQLKTYQKEVNISNEINRHDINIDNSNEKDLNVSQDLNASLSDIEVSKSNFIHDFTIFLNKVNIQIINNFPVSLNEKNKLYFEQSNFWLLVINYLFLQDKVISLYTIVSLLEQYFLWCKNATPENFSKIKDRIKEYINSNYSQNEISQFLFMNQLKSIEEIFQKFEISIKKNSTNYKEIKINNINLQNKGAVICNCELCTSDNACIKKVIDMNKDKIEIVNDINIDLFRKNETLTENNQKFNSISYNEEISYKMKSKKNENYFSKSKTIYTGNNVEYNIINQNNDQNINKNENKEEVIESSEESMNKTYKNISKRKGRKNIKEKENNEIESNNKKEKEEKEGKEEKEEKEESDSEKKNKKKVKKDKKVKSRSISRNRKKRESSKSEKEESNNGENEESIKNEEEDKEEKEERSKSRSKSKKKKKPKKKNKNDKEKNESEEQEEREDTNEKDEVDSSNASGSKRRKSKSPNKKKNRKH